VKGTYDDFVEHPRYGKSPRVTGLNPETNLMTGRPFLHWNAAEGRIPNTAVEADLSRQSPATVPVTHYYDVERTCRDCGRPFIFFALEQKHWYEELGFQLEADCVRCIACRKRQQGIAAQSARYEELFHVADRTAEEDLEMAECCLSLIEQGVFRPRQTQHVSQLLKRATSQRGEDERSRGLRTRLMSMRA
jgi:hypothetical protein